MLKKTSMILLSASSLLLADSVTKDKNFSFKADISSIQLNRIITGHSHFESEVNDIYKASVEAVILPKSYNLKLSYSQSFVSELPSNIYNPLGYDDQTNELGFSAIAYYSKKYGGLGIFYKNTEQNAQFLNGSGAALNIVSYPNYTNIGSVANNQIFQAKDKLTYTGIKYLIPETKFLPEGLNISYAKVHRESINVTSIRNGANFVRNELVALNTDIDTWGIGIEKDRSDLPTKKIALRELRFSKGQSEDSFLDVFEYGIGLSYNSDNLYFDLDYYVLTLETERRTYSGTLNSEFPITIDTFTTIRAGYNF